MIEVTRVGDLTYEIRFDERLRDDLREIAGWTTEELAIERMLANNIIGWWPSFPHFADDEVPF